MKRSGGGCRENWFGPFEDDITHALQYGTRADGATSLVSPLLLYNKESKSKSGMRGKYNHTRAVQLQRLFPQSALINIRKTTANGSGKPRVFHTMRAGAIRNPLRITDPQRWEAVSQQLTELLAYWAQLNKTYNRQKIIRRAVKAGAVVPPHLLAELPTDERK